MDIQFIYHVYTSKDLPCISMDIPCIYFVDIHGIFMDIPCISNSRDTSIHGISMDIPWIYHVTVYVGGLHIHDIYHVYTMYM